VLIGVSIGSIGETFGEWTSGTGRPVAAVPLEAARAAAPKRGHPAGSVKTSSRQKGTKKVQSKSGRSRESDEEEPYIPQRKATKKVV